MESKKCINKSPWYQNSEHQTNDDKTTKDLIEHIKNNDI